MVIGVDLGTSSVKAIIVDPSGAVLATATAPLSVQRPEPGWSEQDPKAWWKATTTAIAGLGRDVREVRAIGLSGQMHGATLLDHADRALRPAILWNDSRSAPACAQLEARVDVHGITGNRAMPGFTAPKLLWLAEHEPDSFRKTARVLLPKDYLRLRLCGVYATDCSDASGTLWLDVGERRWSEPMLNATGLTLEHMPRVVEGSEPTGTLRPELAAAWGMRPDVLIAGGAGDQAAGAIGIGTVAPGAANLSLGTSGVYFVATDRFRPNPARAVHAFCHAIPHTWHQMSVMLSAASCLEWLAKITGTNVAALLAAAADQTSPSELLFLPYLSGERTPYNNPRARGVFFGLDHGTDRAALARAVLEGVGFALADGESALRESGTTIGDLSVIGGGARSRLWCQILASILDRPVSMHAGGEVGPALGAARLARMALTGEPPSAVCGRPPVLECIEPIPERVASYQSQLGRFRRLYTTLDNAFWTPPKTT